MTKKEKESESFETWAMLELFGHQRIAGKVTEQQIGGASFVRIDVPDGAKDEVKVTKFLNPSAIYSITPVSETMARLAAANISVEPITKWDLQDWLAREKMRLIPSGQSTPEEEGAEEEIP